jgi:phosphoheptose isomerase
MQACLNLESIFAEGIAGHIDVIQQLESQRQRLEEIANRMTRALLAGNKILWCGNLARLALSLEQSCLIFLCS